MSSSSESVFLRFNDREDSLPSIDFESGDDLFLLLLDPPWEAGDPFRLLLGPPWEVFDPIVAISGVAVGGSRSESYSDSLLSSTGSLLS